MAGAQVSAYIIALATYVFELVAIRLWLIDRFGRPPIGPEPPATTRDLLVVVAGFALAFGALRVPVVGYFAPHGMLGILFWSIRRLVRVGCQERLISILTFLAACLPLVCCLIPDPSR